MFSASNNDGNNEIMKPIAEDRPLTKKLRKTETKLEVDNEQSEEHPKEVFAHNPISTHMTKEFNKYSLSEEKSKAAERRRAAGLTFFQKQKIAIKYLYTPVQIAVHENYLRFNIPIQVESLYNCTPCDDFVDKLVLGVLMMDGQINFQYKPSITETTVVTATTINNCSRRNVFKCININDQSEQSFLLYGQEFYLCLSHTDGTTMYLTGLLPYLNYVRKIRGRIPLALTKTPDKYCKFRIMDPNPYRMKGLQGTPVKTFECVYIAHSVSKMFLAINLQNRIITSYCIDYEAHCFSNGEPRKNFWKFVTQTIQENAGDQSKVDSKI